VALLNVYGYELELGRAEALRKGRQQRGPHLLVARDHGQDGRLQAAKRWEATTKRGYEHTNLLKRWARAVKLKASSFTSLGESVRVCVCVWFFFLKR
jgi:hypothetical protein